MAEADAPRKRTARRTKDGTVTRLSSNRVEALDKLAKHFGLLRPEVVPPTAAPMTVNYTEIWLAPTCREGLTERWPAHSIL